MASKVVTTTTTQMRVQPLSIALGAAKDKTKDFLTIKNRINDYKNPAKR
jgi:hypothetical protein